MMATAGSAYVSQIMKMTTISPSSAQMSKRETNLPHLLLYGPNGAV
jgi:hypothetical protein